MTNSPEYNRGKEEAYEEVLKMIEGMESTCKEYHNSFIDTPEKIKVFNLALTALKSKLEGEINI